MTEMAEAAVEVADEVTEGLFPPRPGGLVDRHRKRLAEEEEKRRQIEDAPVPDSPYTAVRVRDEAPDLGGAYAVTLSAANPVAMLLPKDATRRNATVLAVDSDVWISYSQGTASGLAGQATTGTAFYLPKGIPVPIFSRQIVYVSCTTVATPSRVSVILSRDTLT